MDGSFMEDVAKVVKFGFWALVTLVLLFFAGMVTFAVLFFTKD